MSTATPSPTKSKTQAKPAAGPVPPAVAPKRRRPPLIAWALLGAAAAAAYGHLILAMRFGPPLVMVALGGLTLALSAGALWRVIDPLTRAELSAISETRAPHRIRELEREKQAVLKAIKEVELDYQMRKISEPDYREMVERYRARALRVMGDLALGDDYRALIERELKGRVAARSAAGADSSGVDARVGDDSHSDGVGEGAGEGGGDVAARGVAPAAGEDVGGKITSTTSTCPTCATTNDADARYCKKCGRSLTPSTPSAAPV